jgi:hypothetical protein
MHYRGVVDSEPGLCFLGLVFQYALSSDVLPGGDRDAEHIAKHIALRRPRGSAAEKRQVWRAREQGDNAAVSAFEDVRQLPARGLSAWS